MKKLLSFTVLSLFLSNNLMAEVIKSDNIDLQKSNVSFTASQAGISLHGEFKRIIPDFFFDSENLTNSKINVSIDLNSIFLGSNDFENEMKKESWFDTSHFPFAQFKSLKISNVSSQKYLVNGVLTIKNMSIPANITFNLKNNKVIAGEFKVKRTDFKLGVDQFSDDSIIANNVLVDFNFKLK